MMMTNIDWMMVPEIIVMGLGACSLSLCFWLAVRFHSAGGRLGVAIALLFYGIVIAIGIDLVVSVFRLFAGEVSRSVMIALRAASYFVTATMCAYLYATVDAVSRRVPDDIMGCEDED